MTVAIGTEVYNVDQASVIARGRSHSAAERDDVLDNEVRALIEDEDGRNMSTSLMSNVSLTGFQASSLKSILEGSSAPKDWEVGEAYSEAYLSAHKDCFFPWADRWDEKKEKSSLPGADLVGLQETDHKTLPYRFVFGEVKTSYEKKSPPGVMYGKEGLKKQTDDLRDNRSLRGTLTRYLLVRASGADWEVEFQSAMKRFLAASTDVAVFGILVRDTCPNQKDIRARAKGLAKGCPKKMHVELLAIYLPAGSIVNLAGFFGSKKKKKPTKKRKKKGGT